MIDGGFVMVPASEILWVFRANTWLDKRVTYMQAVQK